MHIIDSETSSFLIWQQWEISIPYAKFLCLNSLTWHAFSWSPYNFFSLCNLKFTCVSQMFLPLSKGVIVLYFLRIRVRKVTVFFCVVPSYLQYIQVLGTRCHFFFFQKSVHMCYLFWEGISALNGYGFCAKQLVHLSYEVFFWARKLEYWKKITVKNKTR